MTLRTLYDVPAPAKLNLFLHVVGRRADGYHLLQSVFVLIDWADRLHFERREDGRLARHDLGVALPADDLSLRAARALQAQSGCRLGADIHIDKQLPWGAGLGGGSSDAASTLLALNRLWGLHWPVERLVSLAATLGADVPFFVGGRNAFVEGIGERLTPLALPPQRFALAKPAAELATAGIFASPELVRDTEPVILLGSFASAGETDLRAQVAAFCSGFGRNDLQPIAEARCPEVATVARWLEARFGNSRMTGSGSTVFARVGMDDRSLEAWPAQPPPGLWITRLCRSLDHHPLLGWAG